MFFESVYRLLRDWWRALVRPFKPLPKAPEISAKEHGEWLAKEAATRHEEEVAEEERVSREAVEKAAKRRTRPKPEAVVHGWTEAEFEQWWADSTEKVKRRTHLDGWTPPAGVRLSGDNWHYWNTRALDRSRRHDFKDVTTPKGHGMGGDGRQA